jgi:putative methyltransferase (TIGR04325 family)
MVRDFIPPIVERFTRRRMPSVLKQYPTYGAALAESDTYEAPDIIDVVVKKTEIFRRQLANGSVPTIARRQTIQNLFVISYIQPGRPLDVLEFGGACGASYFELTHLLPGRIRSWHVVETSAMTARAREAFQDPRLSFHDNLAEPIAEMKTRDLVIAQGVIQYTPEPLDKVDELLALNFDHVYVTRTAVLGGAVAADDSIIFNSESRLADHGPGVMPGSFADRRITTPCTLVAGASLAARARGNYRQEFWFDEDEPQPLATNQRTVTMKSVGFLLRRVTERDPPPDR